MITVLRIGHRAGRDPRIATHCALVSRALGADRILYTGEHDSEMEESVRKIAANWGGKFTISHEKSWRRLISDFPGKTVHLTMYGMPLSKKISQIRKAKDVMVIVGGEKVPTAVYHISDYNIGIGNQPHSEVAALAIFLHEYSQGKELPGKFPGAKISVIPCERGKRTSKE